MIFDKGLQLFFRFDQLLCIAGGLGFPSEVVHRLQVSAGGFDNSPQPLEIVIFANVNIEDQQGRR